MSKMYEECWNYFKHNTISGIAKSPELLSVSNLETLVKGTSFEVR